MSNTEQKYNFFEDYSKLVSSIAAITKSKEGYGYSYADLSSVQDETKPKIAENNFILIQTVKQKDGSMKREITEPVFGKDKEKPIATKHLNFEAPLFVLHSQLIHKSGQILECEMPLYIDDIDPQAIGSAETYMRRYSLYALLDIKTEDDDGLKASAKGKANKTDQSLKVKLPEDPNQIATFLAQHPNPKIYYQDIKNNPNLDPKLKSQLNKIMYPN